MKLRMVPSEVFSAMNLNENFNYLWSPDPTSSIIGLGTSYLLEFFEFYGEQVGDYFDAFVQNSELADDRFPMFLAQEKRHAAAHRKLNAFMAKPNLASREKYHPRVYDFMYFIYKDFAETLLLGLEQDKQAGKTIDSPYFKRALASIGLFETEFCMSALTFFDQIMDNGRLELMMNMSQNLGIIYLFGYHYVEEMEHCHISIEAYQTIYQQPLWNSQLINQYVNNTRELDYRIINASLYIARKLAVNVTAEQLRNSIAYQARMQNHHYYIKEGFTALEDEIKNKIDYFINKWDNEWEPILLDKIKSNITTTIA